MVVEQRLTREKGKHTMRHIDEFTIHAFRGLRDVKFEGLGQVNLLVGENNSGKTSVLEAISLFCNPLEARKWLGLVDPYDNLSNQISWIFPQDRNKMSSEGSEILLSAVGDIPLKKVSATYERFSEIQTDNSPSAFNSEGGNRLLPYPETSGIRINLSILMMSRQDQRSTSGEENLSATLVFYDDRPHSVDKQQIPAFPAQTISPIEHRFSELAPRLWSEVVEADLKKETIKLLCLFDPSIEDVDIISPTRRQAVVVVRHKKLGHPPLSTFGDGLLRVFTLATTIPTVKGGLLLIDELETAIHTTMLERTFDWLIKACIQNDVQLFATTHSLETIDAILSVCDEATDLVVYRLQKKDKGTAITRFDKDYLTRLREELGVEIRW